jgi:hypothetical protein
MIRSLNLENFLDRMILRKNEGFVLSAEKEHQITNNTSAQEDTNLHADATWGPWLLRITLAGTLLFMWWLVIYDHGVISHH